MNEWPDGWPRTLPAKRLRGDFGKQVTPTRADGTPSYPRKVGLQWSEAVRRVQREVERMRGTGLRVDTAAGNDAEPGVVVSFRLPGNKPVVFPCDRYLSKSQNMAAIAATLEAKRAIERHGVSTLEREFQGYAALPAGAAPQGIETDPRFLAAVRELEGAAGLSGETFNLVRRNLLRRFHPDTPETGNEAIFKALQPVIEKHQQLGAANA